MEVYLNGDLICDNADSLKFHDIKNHFYGVDYEYIDKNGECFTVTVKIDSTKKDYEVRQCRLIRPDVIYGINNKIPSFKTTKVFLIN